MFVAPSQVSVAHAPQGAPTRSHTRLLGCQTVLVSVNAVMRARLGAAASAPSLSSCYCCWISRP